MLMGIDEAGTLARLKGLRRDLIDPQIAAHSGRAMGCQIEIKMGA
jgi:adenylate cyclase